MSLLPKLQLALQELKFNGLYRKRQVYADDYLNFSSNDYLALTRNAQLQSMYKQGFATHPVGSGGSMLVSGYHAAHQAVERAFATALGVEDCLLFASGYTANLSVMALLHKHNAHIILDKGIHASFYDGLHAAAYTRYHTHDIADLAKRLQECVDCSVVVTESIFSMSGYLAPLDVISKLTTSASVDLIVDEAHAFGIIGPQGLGLVAAHGLTMAEVPLRIIPLGKALAASGAIVAGSGVWIEALLQAARAYIYSTGISPAFAYGLQAALNMVQHADAKRARLQELIQYFRDKIKQSPLSWRDSVTPIQQLQLGCQHLALKLAQQLYAQGIICVPMRQPTVSSKDTGLRIILNVDHVEEDINRLFEYVNKL